MVNLLQKHSLNVNGVTARLASLTVMPRFAIYGLLRRVKT